MVILQAEEVAKRLKISKQTLVRYEKKGIFPKPRRNRINQWREYTEEDIKKMEHILGRGVTLIELVMVMSIVGILATLTIPRFQSFYGIKFSGAMKKVVQDIRYVQQISVTTHDDYRIDFNPGLDKYEVRRVSDNSYAKNPFGRDDFIVNFTNDPRYQGIGIDSASFGNSNSSLRFNWEGAPQNGIGTNLAADGVVAFSYKDSSATIHVKPNTGFVTLE